MMQQQNLPNMSEKRKSTKMIPVSALAMFVEAGLSRRKYVIIRSTHKHIYPCYSLLQKAKLDFYPNKESYRVSDTCAEINLQKLLDHTVTRLLNYLQEVHTLSEHERGTLSLICKYNKYNNLSIKKEVTPKALQFGLSVLHARIRLFESVLHVAYNLPVQKWQLRSEDEKVIVKQRKLEIQEEFRTKIGLLVDVPKPGCGNTNDGNTSRRFFADPELAGAITGIDVNLIYRSKVILEVVSSGHKINKEKYSKYATDTAEMYVRLYPWHPITPTTHKILIHGAIVIENALLPIGQLSEEAAEARNKYFRQNFTRSFLGCLANVMCLTLSLLN
jgi:hypothetical protein